MTFNESGLQFNFSKNWYVKKYDRHRYYRWLSGSGLKGVDFIGLYRQNELYLIEVKNFGQYPSSILPEPNVLATAFLSKIADTQTGINTVIKVLNRKWRYRIFGKLAHRLHVLNWLPNEWGFWTQVAALFAHAPKTVNYILLIEMDLKTSLPQKRAYLERVTQACAGALSHGVAIQVISSSEAAHHLPELEVSKEKVE